MTDSDYDDDGLDLENYDPADLDDLDLLDDDDTEEAISEEVVSTTESLNIPDVPASQLEPIGAAPVPNMMDDLKCAFCDCWMAGIRNGVRVCVFHVHHPNTEECTVCNKRKIMQSPNYIPDGAKLEPAHPIPVVSVLEQPDPLAAVMSPDYKDEAGDLDSDYYATFNPAVEEVKDLEPARIQELRHRLDRMIRRAKIQQRALIVTFEGKVALSDSKDLKILRDKDTEWMKKRRQIAEGDGTKSPKKSATGLSVVEKQVKQFVKLNMRE